ncbi:MAG: Gfo/Idh/MocA family oxidoreductase [Bacteroidales bacterium]|nr:Gfo/Idh/MocA family oxidoreductase [Bacteroidales bacterium]MCF8390622.1 Gfo/Idh/MocA family oxidoreductase [Bacteroidales bacterium]
MNTNRRKFIKQTGLATAGLMAGGMSLSAKSYKNILGANDRIHVAIIGLGRRLGAYPEAISKLSNNINLSYLCDVMPSQMDKAAAQFAKMIDYKPKLEKDLRKVFADKKVDAIFNATPDHWHAPGSIMAIKEGKHVYVEKPCSHNMFENELLVEAQKKYNRVVQMGNQQRSSLHTIQVIQAIHDGVIGVPYKATAFYTNNRGRVPLQKPASVPGGLDWELFQGPAPRRDYTEETWDYNWHWYGWDYGTAEAGNNGTHEMDVARWALQVGFPNRVDVDAAKGQFLDDGWEMYDTMDATFKFDNSKSIKWSGISRNGYDTYEGGRGTIIYGSEGSVFINRNKYMIYDRKGDLIKSVEAGSEEAGTALGGGGDTSTLHVENFFGAIRGKENLLAPIADASISMAMVHYCNVAYRINSGYDIDPKNGKMKNDAAMKLWGRTYQPGWEPFI